MKSIDNLREWANGLHGVYINQVDHTITITTGWDAPPDMDSVSLRDHVNGILDGIDREVKELTDERDLLKLQWEAGVDFDQRLEACADKREDVTLWGVDYMPYPLDADGVPIHVGDVMENIVCPSVHREVTGVGVECFYGWDDGNGRYSQFDVVCYRHHHAPTVEDVLREFYTLAVRGKAARADDVDNAVLAEYAARLRLAEDNDGLYEWERDE